MLLQASILKMKDAWIYVRRLFQSRKFSQSVEANLSKEGGRQLVSGVHLHGLCRQFSLAEIKAATNNFHEDLKIGKGSFSLVYKGFIDNGTVVVAVKRLLSTQSWQGLKYLKNEVRFLCQLRHPNIISLVGFCIEGGELILVHDYMNNLSLNQLVHGMLDPLTWEQRLKICIGAARGLHYLHAGVKYAIILRDVKSTNILLDENYNAKIRSFGVSKMGPLSMSKSLIRMESLVVGTLGYLDPEYYLTSELTEKSDVYSFGALLLEVLCARRVYYSSLEEDKRDLVLHACKYIENGSIDAIIDTYLEGKMAPESLQKFVEIAYDCVRPQGKNRPSMGEVEVTLELALELQERAQLHSHSR